VELNGFVSDDGVPSGFLTNHWSKLSGSGSVTFADASAQDTTATFSGVGVYVLKLEAGDGELISSATVQITIYEEGTLGWDWRLMPVRSEDEFLAGEYGGEGEQLPHGAARSPSDPNYIYWNQDSAGPRRSTDGGETWEKPLCKGLFNAKGNAMEVDPVKPLTVFALMGNENFWHRWHQQHQGLYRSTDGGDNWDFVLDVDINYNPAFHRQYHHNIAYDPSSVTTNGAQRWYLAIPAMTDYKDDNPKWVPMQNPPNFGAVYRSEDAGTTWSRTIAFTEAESNTTVYAIECAPDNGDLYMAASKGLFISTDLGASFSEIGDLPRGGDSNAVTSIAIHPNDPDMIYVTLNDENIETKSYPLGKGLYRSTDGGDTFTEMLNGSNSIPAIRVFMNPGFPDVLYAFNEVNTPTLVSYDAGDTWTATHAGEGDTEPPLHHTEGNVYASGKGGGWLLPNALMEREAVSVVNSSAWKTTGELDSKDRIKFRRRMAGFGGYGWSWYNAGMAFDLENPNRFAMFLFDVGGFITDTGGAFFRHINQHASDWVHNKKTTLYGCQSTDHTNGTEAAWCRWFGTYSGSLQPGTDTIVASIGYYYSADIQVSYDNGNSWILTGLTPLAGEHPCHIARRTIHPFIAYHPQEHNVVYTQRRVSYDGGVTWERYPIPAGMMGTRRGLRSAGLDPHGGTNHTVISMCYNHADTIYSVGMSGSGQLFRSDDQGRTWETIDYPLNYSFKPFDRIPVLTVHPDNPNIVYAAITTNKVTTENYADLAIYNHATEEWTFSGLVDQAAGGHAAKKGTFVRNIAVDPNHPNVVYVALEGAMGLDNLWMSEDGGATWSSIMGDMPCGMNYPIAVSPHSSEVFLGTQFGTFVAKSPFGDPSPIYDKMVNYGPECTSTNPPSVPTNRVATASEALIELSWDESIHEGCGIKYYDIFRDGVWITSSYVTGFTDIGEDLPDGLEENTTYSYTLKAVSLNDVESAMSAAFGATTPGDTTAPEVEEVLDTSNHDSVVVIFNEPVTAATAENAANYAIDQGVGVTSASLAADGKTVTLTTTAMGEHDYTLTVSGVQDDTVAGTTIIPVDVPFKYWGLYYPGNPLSWWTFDDTAADAVGSNHGTWSGSSSYAVGRVGQAIVLDGTATGPFITVADDPSLSGMPELTVSVWVKKDDPLVGGQVFKKHVTYDLFLNTTSYNLSGYVYSEVTKGSVQASPEEMQDTEWHHYALVWEDGAHVTAYLDGVQVTQSELPGIAVGTSSHGLIIGKNPWGDALTFNGAIDEMKIFGNALTESQIMALTLERDGRTEPPAPKPSIFFIR